MSIRRLKFSLKRASVRMRLRYGRECWNYPTGNLKQL